MRIERTEWPPPDEEVETIAGIDVGRQDQPGFGFNLGWNQPDRGLKPFLVIWLWRWRVQVGWLAS